MTSTLSRTFADAGLLAWVSQSCEDGTMLDQLCLVIALLGVAVIGASVVVGPLRGRRGKALGIPPPRVRLALPVPVS